MSCRDLDRQHPRPRRTLARARPVVECARASRPPPKRPPRPAPFRRKLVRPITPQNGVAHPPPPGPASRRCRRRRLAAATPTLPPRSSLPSCRCRPFPSRSRSGSRPSWRPRSRRRSTRPPRSAAWPAHDAGLRRARARARASSSRCRATPTSEMESAAEARARRAGGLPSRSSSLLGAGASSSAWSSRRSSARPGLVERAAAQAAAPSAFCRPPGEGAAPALPCAAQAVLDGEAAPRHVGACRRRCASPSRVLARGQGRGGLAVGYASGAKARAMGIEVDLATGRGAQARGETRAARRSSASSPTPGAEAPCGALRRRRAPLARRGARRRPLRALGLGGDGIALARAPGRRARAALAPRRRRAPELCRSACSATGDFAASRSLPYRRGRRDLGRVPRRRPQGPGGSRQGRRLGRRRRQARGRVERARGSPSSSPTGSVGVRPLRDPRAADAGRPRVGWPSASSSRPRSPRPPP